MRNAMLLDPRGNGWVVDVPESHRERARGLLGRTELPPGPALLIERARSVHTFGMRFAIVVALLDAEHRVVGILRVPPRRVVLPRRDVRHVLECGVGTELRPGDRLRPTAVSRPGPGPACRAGTRPG